MCHAYKKEYTEKNKFADVNQQTEPSFTGRFTQPMVQLDPLKTMICINHGKNTVEKRLQKIEEEKKEKKQWKQK